MIGWLIALCAVACLLVLPVGIKLQYNSQGGRALLVVGPMKYSLYPKEKQKKKTRTKNKKFEETRTDAKYNSGSVTDFLPLLQIVLDVFRDFRRKLCISNLELYIVLANCDPCDLAIHYGQTWAGLGNLLPLLENTFRIRKRNIDVACDFCTDTTRVSAKAYLKLMVADVLWLAGKYGMQAILKYFKIMNNRKGGAVT